VPDAVAPLLTCWTPAATSICDVVVWSAWGWLTDPQFHESIFSQLNVFSNFSCTASIVLAILSTLGGRPASGGVPYYNDSMTRQRIKCLFSQASIIGTLVLSESCIVRRNLSPMLDSVGGSGRPNSHGGKPEGDSDLARYPLHNACNSALPLASFCLASYS
jgi:hypothetical protein